VSHPIPKALHRPKPEVTHRLLAEDVFTSSVSKTLRLSFSKPPHAAVCETRLRAFADRRIPQLTAREPSPSSFPRVRASRVRVPQHLSLRRSAASRERICFAFADQRSWLVAGPSSCPWVDRKVSRPPPATPRPVEARFRFGCAPASGSARSQLVSQPERRDHPGAGTTFHRDRLAAAPLNAIALPQQGRSHFRSLSSFT
jgi:hypothetical protein